MGWRCSRGDWWWWWWCARGALKWLCCTVRERRIRWGLVVTGKSRLVVGGDERRWRFKKFDVRQTDYRVNSLYKWRAV
jgi:hypothetical protein